MDTSTWFLIIPESTSQNASLVPVTIQFETVFEDLSLPPANYIMHSISTTSHVSVCTFQHLLQSPWQGVLAIMSPLVLNQNLWETGYGQPFDQICFLENYLVCILIIQDIVYTRGVPSFKNGICRGPEWFQTVPLRNTFCNSFSKICFLREHLMCLPYFPALANFILNLGI